MEFTGERVVPGQTDPDLLNEHVARYGFAESLVSERRVLDAGCGVGYGAKRLARRAASVTALDIASAPLYESRSKYGAGSVNQCQGDCVRLPFRSESFEAVVAFETIEHLQDPGAFLDEAARVLVPSGELIVSTPNRDYYAESRPEPNPFHIREFNYNEFREELEQRFPHVTLFLENHNNAITFTPLEVKGVRTTLEPGVPEPAQAHFFVAVCSRQPLYGSPAFVYLPQSGNVLRDREKHIHLLREEVMQKEKWLAETTDELKELDEIYRKEQLEAQEAITTLENENEEKIRWAKKIKERYTRELAERTQWAESLEEDVTEARGNFARLEAERNEIVGKLKGLLDDAEAQVTERTEWARRLDRKLNEAHQQLAKIYASPAYRLGRRLGLAPAPAATQNESE